MTIHSRFPMFPALLCVLGCAKVADAAPLHRYPADSSTPVLFHFDEAAGGSTAANSGTLGKNARLVDMTTGSATPPLVTTSLGATGFSGLDKAASFASGQLAGWDYNGNGTYQGDVSAATPSADSLPMNLLGIGNGGQSRWTLEAMVYCTLGSLNANQEIIATDSSSASRGLQFRITATGQLELNFIAAGALASASVPTSGTHAYAANTWFHVAATYDGGVVRFYWTRADSSVTSCNLIGISAATVGTSFGSVTGPLCIGGENRNANGEYFRGRLDEVRISKIMRVPTAMHPVYSDTDNDGLSDAWERLYFEDLDEAPEDDADEDGFTNLQEYHNGTNPDVPNTDDSDGDGLPDAWENLYFGNLGQAGDMDTDEDGLTNPAEYAAGSNPANANSVPGDTDGDALPDSWELAELGGFTHGAYDDPDGDGYTNVAEMAASTDPLSATSKPAWKAPRVSLLEDSIVATDALLMPDGATYGRAINGISYNQQILLTFNGYQYTAWYNTAGNTQNVWLARRTVNGQATGEWQTFNTGSEFLNGDENSWDAHNVIALGICATEGTLHMAWDHHNHTLRYRRSVAGLCTTNTAAWGTGMLNAEQNWLTSAGQAVTDVTYPEFTATPSGGLVMNRRIGSSGNGDQLLQFYVPLDGGSGGNWQSSRLFLSRTGNYRGSVDRNAYVNGLDFAPDGKIHVTWTWREGASTSNHDICHAYSTDNGVTWRNTAGELIADTGAGQSINLDTAGIKIKALNTNQLLINQQSQCVTSDGAVHALMLHRRAEPAYEYPNVTAAAYSTLGTAYHHYFRDPATGTWSQRRLPAGEYPVGSRPKIAHDAAGNLYAAYVSYNTTSNITPGLGSGKLVVASASKASGYTDWRIAAVVDSGSNGQPLPYLFTGEPIIDQPRLTADGILSVYVQEHGASSSTALGRPLHVIEFQTTPNTAPSLAPIPDATLDHGTSSLSIPLFPEDPETPSAELLLSVVSSDESVVTTSAITLSQTGGNWQALIFPAGMNGTTTITITAGDGLLQTSRSFQLRVRSELESWRFAHFGTGENSGDAADDADPDHDGWPNASEFIAGTDPGNPGSLLKVTSLSDNAPDITLGFETVANRLYRVEWSDNLSGWTTVLTDGSPAEDIAGTGGQILVNDSGGAGHTARFYRVAVTKP